MDRLTLFPLDWPWARSNDKWFVWSTWMGLCSWNFSSFPEFWCDISYQEQFCPAIFCHRRYHAASVEPETERKGDSCASARNVTAGVDVSHSGQGNDGNASVVLVPHSRIRKKLYRKCRSMMNMRGAWRRPLYVRKKETAVCRDHIDGTVVHVLRSCRSVS